MCICICTHIHICVYMCIHTHTYITMYIPLCMYGIYICVYVYVHIYTYVCMCICMCIPYIYVWNIHICTQWNIIQPSEKQRNPIIYNNMGSPWRHYAKWNKSNREKQILNDLTYTWNLRKPENEKPNPWKQRYQTCGYQRQKTGQRKNWRNMVKAQTSSHKINKF